MQALVQYAICRGFEGTLLKPQRHHAESFNYFLIVIDCEKYGMTWKGMHFWIDPIFFSLMKQEILCKIYDIYDLLTLSKTNFNVK